MMRLALHQMRSSVGRLVAAGVAVALGAAFVAATLLGGSMIRDTAYRTMTASLADADVVLHTGGGEVTAETVREVAEVPGVAAADGQGTLYAQVEVAGDGGQGGVSQDVAMVAPVASDPALDPYTLTEGEMAASDGEVVLTESSAERLDLAVGDTVTVQWEVWGPPSADAEWTPRAKAAELVVSGLVEDPSAIFTPGSVALVTRDAFEGMQGEELQYMSVLVVAEEDVSPDQLAEELAAAHPGLDVRTAVQEAELQAELLTGEARILTYFVLAFAGLAMFVAGIVIANTFQVLVAQRSRTLALLRCVGATKAQVHRSVLLEATLLGVVAGAVGVLAGLGVGQVALWLLASADLPVQVPTTLAVTPAVVVVPLVTSAVVTLVAAIAPARVATRVAPLAALRPPEAPAVNRAGGRTRFWVAVVLGTLGVLLLGGGVVASVTGDGPDDVLLPLAAGLLGGMLSFAAVLVGAVFVLPAAVRATGRLVGLVTPARHRQTVALTTANATRNPRRTAATASALLIGVTLVMIMATGAETARSTLDEELTRQYPVDLSVESVDTGTGRAALTDAQIRAVAEVPGVATAVAVSAADLAIAPADGDAQDGTAPGIAEGVGTVTQANGLDVGALDDVVRDPDLLTGLSDDSVLLGHEAASAVGVADGEPVLVSLAPVWDESGVVEPDGDPVRLTAHVRDGMGWSVFTTAETMSRLGADGEQASLWAAIDARDPDSTVRDVRDAVAGASGEAGVPYVSGAAAERQAFGEVIDTLLAILVALLGVAVVIALIGVANTLSLSVIERRRENALLRATGLTRGQLRGMLAAEGVMLALVGTLVGAVMGLLYGWAGAAVLLGGVGSVSPAVPWAYLGAILGVAVLAGLLASVLPARGAVRVSPVAALATD